MLLVVSQSHADPDLEGGNQSCLLMEECKLRAERVGREMLWRPPGNTCCPRAIREEQGMPISTISTGGTRLRGANAGGGSQESHGESGGFLPHLTRNSHVRAGAPGPGLGTLFAGSVHCSGLWDVSSCIGSSAFLPLPFWSQKYRHEGVVIIFHKKSLVWCLGPSVPPADKAVVTTACLSRELYRFRQETRVSLVIGSDCVKASTGLHCEDFTSHLPLTRSAS